MSDLSTEIVDALNENFGRHAGARAVHAKGIVMSGRFVASGAAAALTTAAHLQADAECAVVARFSNASGDPEGHDGARDGRGFAVKFQLADGSNTDIVAISTPAFLVRTPEDFLAFTRARRPDAATGTPDAARVGAFIAAHPETARAAALAGAIPPTGSYAALDYHGLHAFAFTNAAGESRFVRYHWCAEAAPEPLSDDDARARSRDFLQDELRARVATRPVRFRLELQLGEAGDDVTDPTQPWPDARNRGGGPPGVDGGRR